MKSIPLVSPMQPVPVAPVLQVQARLTIRSATEILKMDFDPNHRFLENGVFAKGQPLCLLGPGGIGKSRLLLQLAICTILGTPFLGLEVRAKNLRWLIIQAENSNWRLQRDLHALRVWVGPEDWKKVESHLTFHTLEQPADSRLSLADESMTTALTRLIADTRPDVIAFDPLGAFATASLNHDAGMLATCRAIDQLAHAGGHRASVVVLHHTLTGKSGAKKATGIDRGSYGRGSKSLNFWTRGQINLAPAGPDANDRLVVSCGKNSNGKEFDTFGVLLNPNTLIYEVDPDFNVEEWQREISGKKPVKPKMNPETVAGYVRDAPKLKKVLVRALMEETGCEKSTAYNAINEADGVTIRRNVERFFEVIP